MKVICPECKGDGRAWCTTCKGTYHVDVEKTAYHKWLIQKSKEMSRDISEQRKILALAIHIDCVQHNLQAFDLIELTGDKKYNDQTFFKAADLLLNDN